MKNYQLTIEEMLDPDKIWPAKAEPAPERGLIDYLCPVCGSPIGIYSTGAVHEEGWFLRRETCQNGHKIYLEED